jgi:hypothetical protein
MCALVIVASTTITAAGCAPEADIARSADAPDSGLGPPAPSAPVHPSAAPDGGSASARDAANPVDAAVGDGFTRATPAGQVGYVAVAPAGTPSSLGLEGIVQFANITSSNTDERSDGPCTVTRTDPTGSVQSANEQAGQVNVASYSILPLADKSYPPLFNGAWPAGQTVHIQAAGGDVPAFSGDVLAPQALTVTTPYGGTFGTRQPLAGGLSKGADLALAWTPTSSSVKVTALLYENYAGATHPAAISISCTFDGSLGAGTIPSSALRDLSTTPATQGGPLTTLELTPSSTLHLQDGTYAIRLTGLGEGMVFDVSGSVTP